MSSKKSELSLFTRAQIITLHNEGKSLREIEKIVERPFSSVRYVIKKFEETKNIENLHRSGRPKILNKYDERGILREVNENPKISAQSLAVKVAECSGKSVCAETVRKVIRKAGYNGRIVRKKPYISEQNRIKRLDFAKMYINESPEFWKKVLFTDESKFNLFGSDGKRYVWRKPNKELDIKNVTPTIKHGGGSVLVWGCMSYNGVGNLHFIDGIMDSRMYLDILKQNLRESTRKLEIDDNFILQQDNDPKHTARVVKEWILYNVPKSLPHPPQSPDINPIENLWHILDVNIRKHNISNKADLKQHLREEWAKMNPLVTNKLIMSMPKRLQAVIDAKGLHTKY